MKTDRPHLAPTGNVRRENGRFLALDARPWIELFCPRGPPAGRWIEIAYRSGFLDPLIRPVIRFHAKDGDTDQWMAAALFGRARWFGRVPDWTERILICPVDRSGPFDFEIEAWRALSRLELVGRALGGHRKYAWMALGARLIGSRREARQALQFAIGGTAIEAYHAWRAEHMRGFEPDGLDRPRADRKAPHIRLCCAVNNPRDPRLSRLATALAGSSGSLALVHPACPSAPALACPTIVVAPDADCTALGVGLEPDDLIGTIRAGDEFPSYSLAVLHETAATRKNAALFYGDSDHRDDSGRYHAPGLKPDWSPAFEHARGYVGPNLFWRTRLGAVIPNPVSDLFLPAGRAALLAAASPAIVHVRRVLVTMTGPPDPSPPASPSAPSLAAAGAGPAATIIIPTKDRVDLIRACIDGLRTRTKLQNFEVIIVDNGSTEAAVPAFYETLRGDDRITILPRPGPFNFSAQCNAAAARAKSPVLVFLNDDIVVTRGDWLAPLVAWASLPDVGAVGARLLYPDGRLQHAGVVAGMGGYAAHVCRDAVGDAPGYLGRLAAPHEVSAVTGACLAVAARKFHAVGGFDADHLPVELNDIDLCLRLGEKGWRTICTPRSEMIHRHSASRGFSRNPFTRYDAERAYFRERWAHILRDDPYFHPALSLFSFNPELESGVLARRV